MSKQEILYGTIIVADEQAVRGKGENIKIKRRVIEAVFKHSDTHWRGLQILSVEDFKVVGHTNRPV